MSKFDKKPVVSVLENGTIEVNICILLDYASKLVDVYVFAI